MLFAVTAATAVAAPPAGKGGGKGQEKVTLCHKVKVTIVVGAPAVKGHMQHGDALGACGATTGAATGGTTDAGTTAP